MAFYPWPFSVIISRLDALSAKLDILISMEGRISMATKQTLDDLTAAVAANTDRVSSITQALQGLTAANADLTAKLEAALASDDEAAVEAAVNAIKANNDAMAAAIPQLAQAAVQNT